MSDNEPSSAETTQQVMMDAQEAFELQRLAILNELEENLESWAKKRFRTALIAISVLGFIGIQAIGYLIIDTALGNRIEEAAVKAALMAQEASRIQKEGDSVIKKAKEAADQTIAKLAALEAQADSLNDQFEGIYGEGILRPGDEDDQPKPFIPSLTQLQKEIESLRGEIANLAVNFKERSPESEAAQQAPSSDIADKIDDIAKAVLVKQTATPAKSAKASDSKKWYTVAYEIEVDAVAEKIIGQNVVSLIDKVVYKRDEKWFESQPYIVSVNRKNNFKIFFNVWGSTKVAAEIHIYGVLKPIVREGYISLGDKPKILDLKEPI